MRRLLLTVFCLALLPIASGGKRWIPWSASSAAPAWHDIYAEGSINDSFALLAATFIWGGPNALTVSGTQSVSGIRFKCAAYSATTSVKIAVYNSSGTLMASASTSVTATGVYEITISPVSFPADTYKALIIGNGNSSDITFSAKTGTNTLLVNGDSTYAAFPGATYPSMAAYTNQELWWGIYY